VLNFKCEDGAAVLLLKRRKDKGERLEAKTWCCSNAV
jgi:hypothetical protein